MYFDFEFKSRPDTEGCLHESDDAWDEEDGRDEVTSGGVVALHAQSRTNDEGNRHSPSEHRQIVLSHCNKIHFNSDFMDSKLLETLKTIDDFENIVK